jgi:hypothetical protein
MHEILRLAKIYGTVTYVATFQDTPRGLGADL